MLVWLSAWNEVQTCIWPSGFHCHSLSLASVKSRLVLPFWYRLTWVVPDKGPLNGCVTYLFAVECRRRIARMLLMLSVLSVSRYRYLARLELRQVRRPGCGRLSWLNSYVRHSLVVQAGGVWSVAQRPAMRFGESNGGV